MIRSNPVVIDENNGVTPKAKAHDNGTNKSVLGLKNNTLRQSQGRRKALGELSDTKLNARKQKVIEDQSKKTKNRIPNDHESQSIIKCKSGDAVSVSLSTNIQSVEAATEVLMENDEGFDEDEMLCTRRSRNRDELEMDPYDYCVKQAAELRRNGFSRPISAQGIEVVESWNIPCHSLSNSEWASQILEENLHREIEHVYTYEEDRDEYLWDQLTLPIPPLVEPDVGILYNEDELDDSEDEKKEF